MLKVYDTSALLELCEEIQITSEDYVSVRVVQELEHIKTSNKSPEVKAQARQMVRMLQINKDYQSLLVSEKEINKIYLKYKKYLPDNNDTRILLEAVCLARKQSVEFLTGDLTLFLFSRMLFEGPEFHLTLIGEISKKRFWDGCVSITPTESDWILLSQTENCGNIFNLKINEYAILYKDDQIVDICRWDGTENVKLGYQNIRSTLFGKIAPRNLEQKCYFDLLQNPNIPIVNCVGRTGSGKAMTNDTPIPTPDGIKELKDIQVGDYVFGRDGKPTKVIGVYPQGLCDVYEVKLADGRIVYCNDEHLWTYQSSFPDGWRTVTLRHIIDHPLAHGYFIPMNAAVQFSHKAFSIPPYVIGAFLGDGCCKEKALTLSSENEEIPIKVSSLLSNIEKPIKQHPQNYSWKFLLKQERLNPITKRTYKYEQSAVFFKDFPELLKKASEKSIPEQYLYGDIQQRTELLQGLMDTDGSIGLPPKGRCSFTSTSLKLVEQVQWLINSLGWQTSFYIDNRPEKYRNEEGSCYSLRITVPREEKYKLFSLSRKVERAKSLSPTTWSRTCQQIRILSIRKMPYQKEMTCLRVDNPECLFLIGNFVVTHNTFLAIANALYLIEQGQYDKLYYIRNNFEVEGVKDAGALPGTIEEKLKPFLGPLIDIVGSEEYVEELINSGKVEQLHLGFLRGRSLKNCVVIVDESQNLTPGHIKMLISRMAENSKLIFTGDYSQIDSKIFRNSQNGIMRMNDTLQNNELYGQIRLNKIERSAVCQLADKID